WQITFQEVLAQDVYNTEPQTPRRRVRNVNYYTCAQIESMKKQKCKQVSNPIQESNVQQQNTLVPEQTSFSANPLKRLHRTTSEIERTILSRLLELGDTISNNKIQEAVSDLNTVSSDWTDKKVRQYLINHKNKKV
ncbi:13746_t:CDS:1, partial [Racocetra fulgida]